MVRYVRACPNGAQLSKYPALNRFDKHLPVPKSYIAVTGLAILTIVRI